MSTRSVGELAFGELALPPALLGNLDTLGYVHMTPIQASALPPLLQGRDLIAQAHTGTGKTVAFGLGLLSRLKVERFRVQSLVLCPTRELADQVAREIRRLARAVHNIKVLTLCGGMPLGPQIGSLQHGAHIVVGTPGRVEEHLRKGRLNPEFIDALVLDEADRMLDMGFQDSLDKIVEFLPRQRQTLLFSATYPPQIEAIAGRVLREPVRVSAQPSAKLGVIEQFFYEVEASGQRPQAVTDLLVSERPESAMVFCNTKRETQELVDFLRSHGVVAVALHGDLIQRDREQVLVRFANQSATVLVATDVAARGLDIEALDCVINYQPARDSEVHVHRAGRTGRAGLSGRVHTLFSARERHKLEQLETQQGLSVKLENLPEPLSDSRSLARPLMVTLQIDGGKKNKVRPGDILGALTGSGGIEGSQVGKIHISDFCSYVAVQRQCVKSALKKLGGGKIKGRKFRVRQLR